MSLQSLRHILVYNDYQLFCNTISYHNEVAVYQTPLVSSGIYSSITGVKCNEIRLTGKVPYTDKANIMEMIYDMKGKIVSAMIDSSNYDKLVLINSDVEFFSDSSLGSFELVFRRFDNE